MIQMTVTHSEKNMPYATFPQACMALPQKMILIQFLGYFVYLEGSITHTISLYSRELMVD